MISLNLKKIKSNITDVDNAMEYAIKAYYNYCNCNDFSDLKCPYCNKHSLSFHKIYERNIAYYNNNQVINTKINITVCKCEHCSKESDKQKYHAILPEFIFPYTIYEASTIIKALNDYINKMKLKEILERLQITHKLFYDWLKKIKIYSLSSSIVLGINNDIKDILNGIIDYNSEFLKWFYDNFRHPFFLFKLTCVPLCIIP